MSLRKQRWHVGDVFTVRTSDGMYIVGQIVGREAHVLNSVSVAFFDVRVADPAHAIGIALVADLVFSIVFSTRDRLDSGKWVVVENRPLAVGTRQLPYEEQRSLGYVGAKVIGSANLEKFLNAYYALAPWDDWADPTYLDRLLISSSKKPSRLIFKTDSST